MTGIELLARILPVDWSTAKATACRYQRTRTDWWRVECVRDGVTYTVVGEDTDGDGVVDFLHADTTGSGRIDFSAFIAGGNWQMTNLLEAWVQVDFSLPWSRTSYVPHDVIVLFNGVPVGSFEHAIPEGHYSFPVPPRAIAFPGDPQAGNQLEIKSAHLPGGHYIVTSNFQVVYRLTQVDAFVVAESREAATEKVLATPGFRFRGADLSVDSSRLALSKTDGIVAGEKIELRAEISNLGMDPATNVEIALLQSLPGGGSPLEIGRVTLDSVPLLGVTPVTFPWVAVPGEHTLRVVVDPDQKLEDTSRFNNQALVTVSVPGKEAPPQLEIVAPAEGQAFTSAEVPLDARGIDGVGILAIEHRIDDGLWQLTKGAEVKTTLRLAPGSHRLYVRVTDCAGAVVSAERGISVTYVPPAIQIVAPAEGAEIAADRVAVRIAVEQPKSLRVVRVSIGGGVGQEHAPAAEICCELPSEPGRQRVEVCAMGTDGAETVVSREVLVRLPAAAVLTPGAKPKASPKPAKVAPTRAGTKKAVRPGATATVKSMPAKRAVKPRDRGKLG